MGESSAELGLGPVAGIAIKHSVEDGIQLAEQIATGWVGGGPPREPIQIRHVVGDTDVQGLTPVMEIEPWSTYYDDGAGGTAIRYRSHSRDMPVRVLRTLRPGREYMVHYEFRPEIPMMRRDKELAVYALALGERGLGLMAHGCGFLLPTGKAVAGLGVSGAGKSTLAAMMRRRGDVAVLNDDRIVLTREAGGLHAWATPWPGSAGIWGEGSGPLGVAVFIAKGEARACKAIPRGDALRRLLRTIALPLWSSEKLDESLAIVEMLLATVPLVELRYPLDPGTPDWILKVLEEVST